MKKAYPIFRIGEHDMPIENATELKKVLIGIIRGTVRVAGRTTNGLPIYEATRAGMFNLQEAIVGPLYGRRGDGSEFDE